MQYITRNELSQLKGKNLLVKSIYGPKREGFNPTTNKMESFVFQVDKWKKRQWNQEKKTFELLDEGKVDYSIHKKKYDIVFELANEVSIKVQKYNKDKKENYYEDVEDNSFTVQSVSATMLGDMLAVGVAFGKVPTNEEGFREYDWEEKFLKEAEGMITTFDCNKKKYDINGKSGTYFEFTFAKPVDSSDVVEDDSLPF